MPKQRDNLDSQTASLTVAVDRATQCNVEFGSAS